MVTIGAGTTEAEVEVGDEGGEMTVVGRRMEEEVEEDERMDVDEEGRGALGMVQAEARR
jgi:hypothetical protein